MIWPTFLLVLVALPLVAEWGRMPVGRRRRRGVPGEVVTLPGGRTHVVREGPEDGPVVVMIHGITTPHYVWAGVAPLLAQAGYRVIRYDLFGRGFSDRPIGRQDAAFFTAQLDALMLREEVEEPYALVGFSMGGAIAVTKAAQSPDDVTALALVAPTGLAPAAAPAFLRIPVLGDWVMWICGGWLQIRRLAAMQQEPSAIPDYLKREADEARTRGYARSVLSALRRLVLRDLAAEHAAVAEAGTPVLAIWATNDQSVPLRSAGRLAELNPNAWQHQIEGAGHGVPHNRPGEVAAELIRFLGAHSDRG